MTAEDDGDPQVAGAPPHGPMRTVIVLAACQALAMTGTTMLIIVSALAGRLLAPHGSLATLPLALMFLATMATTIPASLLMKRVGRRAGFTLGAALGLAAALTGAAGIVAGKFTVFAIGAVLQGMYNAFWQYYRFAAADAVDAYRKSRAISYVMAGGIAAALFGPELAKATAGLLESSHFAGSYVAMAVLALAATGLLQFVDIPRPGAAERRGSGRPVREILAEPTFLIAVMAAMIGYGVMAFVMTATPLAMHHYAHAFDDTAFVIQWHALGMFVPSFFTGHLIRWFGAVRIVLVGTVAMLASVAVNLAGTGLPEFWTALLLLGIGWNFMFIGGTTLLTEIYTVQEKAKVQAMNDFLVFGTNAIASFSSGFVHDRLGWQAVNYAALLPLLIVLAAALWLRLQRRAARQIVGE